MEIACGQLLDPLLHCPEQAYITVSERCIYDCKFCAVPKLQGGVKSRQTVQRMVEDARKTGKLHCISLTSGVEESPEFEAKRVQKSSVISKALACPLASPSAHFPE